MTFEEIKQMSEFKFKKMVKQKTMIAAFKYLMEQKKQAWKTHKD